MTDYSITLFGRGSVGKSAILIQYVRGYFVENYDPTIEDNYQKTINFKDKTIQLKMYDTAGEESLRSYSANYIRNSNGFIIVFALNDMASFEEVEELYNEINLVNPNSVILLCGNKSDLKDDREVTREEAEELARSMKAEYIETSAKTCENIDELFIKITEMISKTQSKDDPIKPVIINDKRRFCLLL